MESPCIPLRLSGQKPHAGDAVRIDERDKDDRQQPAERDKELYSFDLLSGLFVCRDAILALETFLSQIAP